MRAKANFHNSNDILLCGMNIIDIVGFNFFSNQDAQVILKVYLSETFKITSA